MSENGPEVFGIARGPPFAFAAFSFTVPPHSSADDLPVPVPVRALPCRPALVPLPLAAGGGEGEVGGNGEGEGVSSGVRQDLSRQRLYSSLLSKVDYSSLTWQDNASLVLLGRNFKCLSRLALPEDVLLSWKSSMEREECRGGSSTSLHNKRSPSLKSGGPPVLRGVTIPLTIVCDGFTSTAFFTDTRDANTVKCQTEISKDDVEALLEKASGGRFLRHCEKHGLFDKKESGEKPPPPPPLAVIKMMSGNYSADARACSLSDVISYVQASSTGESYCVQAYVPGPGRRASVTRVCWGRDGRVSGTTFTSLKDRVPSPTTKVDVGTNVANMCCWLTTKYAHGTTAIDTIRGVESVCDEPIDALRQVAAYADSMLLRPSQTGQPPRFVSHLVGDFVKDYEGTWYLVSIKAAKVSDVPASAPGRPISAPSALRSKQSASSSRAATSNPAQAPDLAVAANNKGKARPKSAKLPARSKGLGRGCKGDYCGSLSCHEAFDELRARMYALGSEGMKGFDKMMRQRQVRAEFRAQSPRSTTSSSSAVDEAERREYRSQTVTVGGVGTTSEDLRQSYTDPFATSSAPVLAPRARPLSASTVRTNYLTENVSPDVTSIAASATGTGGHVPYRMIAQDRATGCSIGTEPVWFWQADDGVTWVPYAPDHQTTLEEALELNFKAVALTDRFVVTFRKCVAGQGIQYLSPAGGPFRPNSLSRRVKREPSPHTPLLPHPTRARQSACVLRGHGSKENDGVVPDHALRGSAAPSNRAASYQCGYEPYDLVYVCKDCYRVYLAKEQVRKLRDANVAKPTKYSVPLNPFAEPGPDDVVSSRASSRASEVLGRQGAVSTGVTLASNLRQRPQSAPAHRATVRFQLGDSNRGAVGSLSRPLSALPVRVRDP